MPRLSAGILLYRRRRGDVEVLLVHPGGPYWAKKDDGAWSLPKGEYGDRDDPLAAARREFTEELGRAVPAGRMLPLGEVTQKGGKRVSAWAVEGDLDSTVVGRSTFELEWPPRSGRVQRFPEVDRAGWFTLDAAHAKLLAAQTPFLDRIAELLRRLAG